MPVEGEQGDLLVARLLSTDAPSSPQPWPDVVQKRHPPAEMFEGNQSAKWPGNFQRRLVSVVCISDGISHAQAAKSGWQGKESTFVIAEAAATCQGW